MLPRSRFALLLVAFALVSSTVAHAKVPAITAPVVDLANVLSTVDVAAIEMKLVALREATGAQMAVLLVQSLDRRPIDDFAQEVFTAWGGGSRTRDDGLLLVIAVRDRQNRLHLGYGIESMISDGTAETMLAGMRADLRAERYGPAIEGLVDAVSGRLTDLTPESPGTRAFAGNRESSVGSSSDPETPTLPQNPKVFLVAASLAWIAGFVRRHFCESAGPDEKLPKYASLAIFLALPLLLLIVMGTLGGLAFGLGYGFTWCVMAGGGHLSNRAIEKSAWSAGLFGTFFIGVKLVLWFFPEEPLAAIETVQGTLGLGIALLILIALCRGVEAWDLSSDSGSDSVSSSGSSSRRRSSSGSSGSRSSSGSSGGRSWGGRGGSSGGGGASSGW